MANLDYPAAELERQFNPRVAVPDHEATLTERAALSAAVRERLRPALDVRYGDGPKETLDIFPAAAAGAPVHVYFHGGYWRAGDNADVSFVAEPLVRAGVTAVLPNYDLCPDVTLDEIVAEARRAIAWCQQNISGHGGDPARITISGSSAGGHLAAMALAHDWEADGLPADTIKGAVLITGVYDAEPACHISLNDELRLEPETARRLSPIHNPPRRPLPLVAAVGGAETEEWVAMSRAYVQACEHAGIACRHLEVPGEDHFSMTALLGDAEGPLVAAILGQLGLGD
ncbi:MAG: alpha/beta hydrolase [Alphaproteobacteria bacterium]|jgi:arylformamidase|nr:alpha/beta hydrolase [Alphaproteobacteria bacterium]